MLQRSLLLLLAVMLLVSTISFAQKGKLPPFRMVQANGKVFKAEDLPMGKPIVLIYFSPDCDHCHKLMKQLLQRAADLKKASIAMITYQPVDQVTKFVADFKLSKYPNISVGTEGSTFFVRNYYKIEQMPFMALYARNGDLKKLYYKEGELNDLSARLRKL